jgi:hypothetical protein
VNVAFLNNYYPPDAAITGESLAELVSHLRGRDPRLKLRVYAGTATYGIGENNAARTDTGVEVIRIGPSRRYKGKLGRLVQSVSVGRRMAREALAWADVIVSLTDPPLVGLWIGRKRTRTKRPVRWIEWTMDLFPEAFAAAKLVRKSNPIYRLISASLRKNASDAYICLGKEQSKALELLRGVRRPTVVLPCGIVDAPANSESVPAWRQAEHRMVIVYAGNLGEAHCPHFLTALVDAADPTQFAFLFAIHGIHAPAVRDQLRDRTNIHWVERISHAELVHAEVHAASLHPDWTHTCVPSKAVTTICLGRPLLFAGDLESDTVSMLNRASWILPVPRDGKYDRSAIRSILDEVANPETRALKGREAKTLAETLRANKGRALTEIADLILGRADPRQRP